MKAFISFLVQPLASVSSKEPTEYWNESGHGLYLNKKVYDVTYVPEQL